VYNNYYRNNDYGVASTCDAEVLVEGCYFENVNHPTLVGYGSSWDGDLVQRYNSFSGSGSPETSGSVPNPPYGYSRDNASSIPSIVRNGVGTGKIGGGSTTTTTSGCNPTSITPYIQINDGSWQQTNSVTVNSGDKVKFGPQPVSGGSWSWSGCGTSGSSREQTIYPTSSCTSTATYTNSCGAQSWQNFYVTVSGGSTTTTTTTTTSGGGGGDYSLIQNRGSGNCMRCSSGSNGASITMESCNSSYWTEQWDVHSVQSGWYQFKNRNSGKCIRNEGGNVYQYTCYSNYWTEMFKLNDAGSGYRQYQNRSSNQCLRESGGVLVQYTCYSYYWSEMFKEL
jgi:hypothetical protein